MFTGSFLPHVKITATGEEKRVFILHKRLYYSNRFEMKMIICHNNTTLDYLISSAIIMLFLLTDLSWCRPARMNNQEESCKPKLMTLTINLTDCEPLEILLYGCAGHCRSDTTINNADNDPSLVSSYSCCKPLSDVKFGVAVTCPNEKDGYRNVDLVSAKECACTEHNRSVEPSIATSWHKARPSSFFLDRDILFINI